MDEGKGLGLSEQPLGGAIAAAAARGHTVNR
jgi:hypothetical protein